MEADYEAARLLTLQAAWMADNGKPNSLQASMAKAKAGRTCVDVTLGCVELCGSVGYGENELLEKWARDAKILDIFEGTQQIQLLIVARQLLGKSSAELRLGGARDGAARLPPVNFIEEVMERSPASRLGIVAIDAEGRPARLALRRADRPLAPGSRAPSRRAACGAATW